jgi:nitroreductase
MNTLQAIINRQSCRKFTNQQISQEILDYIVGSASTAPVAYGAYDDYYLIVVQKNTIISMISSFVAQKTKISDCFYNAPTIILVCAKFKQQNTNIEYISVGCILENMALACTENEISSVVVTSATPVLLEDMRLINALQIPEESYPVCFLAVGYPEQKTEDADGPRHTINATLINDTPDPVIETPGEEKQ